MHDYHRRHLEDDYLFPLIELGDKRIAAKLAQRSRTAGSVRIRRKWAYAAHWLGDPQPLKSYAEAFQAGKIVLPANNRPQANDSDQPGNVELLGIVRYLANVDTPEADRALYALADPKHRYYRMASERVLKERASWNDAPFAHPYCLRILRRALDDESPTGATYTIEHDALVLKDQHGSGSSDVPDFLADPAARRVQATERASDITAEKLNGIVAGLPRYHPLLKDADERLRAMKAALDRFDGNYRRANARETRLLELNPWAPTFLPDIRPLGRAATVEDVNAGKAIFHLHGKGKPADLALPAVAVLQQGAKKKRLPHVLIVQAEVAADGQVIYGIIMKEAIRAVSGRNLTGIKTLADLGKEEKEAAQKRDRQ